MSNEKQFQLTIDGDQVAWLKIDVKNMTVNILQVNFVHDMNEIFDELEPKSHDLKGLIFYSGKENNFIAGADIKLIDDCDSVEDARVLAASLQALFERIEQMPFTTIAAINGGCFGGGLELALACDYRICTKNARLGLPEVKLGLLPGAGGTQRLPRLIGLIPAIDLILSGRHIIAKEADKLGLVDVIIDQESLLNACHYILCQGRPIYQSQSRKIHVLNQLVLLSWVRSLVLRYARKKAQRKAKKNYPAINVIIQTIDYGLEHGFDAGMRYEAEQFGELVMTPESNSLRRLFFLTVAMKKRHQPEKNGHKLEKLAIVGGGFMGAGIAYVSLNRANLSVCVKDVNHSSLLNVFKYSMSRLKKGVVSGRLTPFDEKQKQWNLTGCMNYHDMVQSDVIIEAVFEDLKIKQHVLQACESIQNTTTIFATNTSSIPITRIAEASNYPEKVIGLHYFSPVVKMPLVEVIPHQGTDEKTVETVIALAYRQGKIPIRVKDSAGFYVNRILVPYIQGALLCLQWGEPIELIDSALENFGFPVGPFTLLDEVGFDVAGKIPPILRTELGDRFESTTVFDTLISAGRKGRKSGLGFYLYGHGENKRVDSKVYSLLGISINPQLKSHEIIMCCLLPMLNEAVRCFDESVIECVEDGDLGAVLGIGFPPFLSGPFYYMDQQGLGHIISMMKEYQMRFGTCYAPCDKLVSMRERDDRFYPLTKTLSD